MAVRYGSGCSGIEALSVAVEPMGWKPVYFSEIEKFPSAVLKHRWPSVPNLGDFTAVDGAAHPVDVLVAGTPCQSFSFAGLRKSLEDVRGNIMFAFIRLAHATPALRYALWENVPGVLSTDDNAFGCLLGGLVGADDPVRTPDGERWPDAGMVAGPLGRAAWRVLDAQYFRLAQRRRRVFVVFCPAGSSGDPAAILFERQGLHRHPPSRGEAGQRPAGTLAARTQGGGGLGTDFDLDGGLGPVHQDIAHTLRGEGFDASEDGTGRGTPLGPVAFGGGNRSGAIDVTATLTATLTAKGNRQDFEVETFIAQPAMIACDVADTLTVGANQTTGFVGDVVAYEQPVAFTAQDYGADAASDLSPTLRAGGFTTSHANAGVMPAIAFALRGRDEGNVPEVEGTGDTAGTLRAASGGSTPPHVAYSIMPQNSGKDYKAREVEVAQPLMAAGPAGGNQGGDYIVNRRGSGRPYGDYRDPLPGETSNDYWGRMTDYEAAHGIDPTAASAFNLFPSGPEGATHAVHSPVSNALTAEGEASKNGRGLHVVEPTQYAVRRLTPTECARLQGFPDDHARIPWGKGETPDGPMYKAYGNSMAVPCMRWIAARIDAQVNGLPLPGLTEVLAMTDPDAPAAQEG